MWYKTSITIINRCRTKVLHLSKVININRTEKNWKPESLHSYICTVFKTLKQSTLAKHPHRRLRIEPNFYHQEGPHSATSCHSKYEAATPTCLQESRYRLHSFSLLRSKHLQVTETKQVEHALVRYFIMLTDTSCMKNIDWNKISYQLNLQNEHLPYSWAAQS